MPKETGPKARQSVESAYEEIGKVELPSILETGFVELNKIRGELRKDGIEVSELFEYRVTVLRMFAEAKVTELDAQIKLFKLNSTKEVGERIVQLHDQLRNISERIAQELVTHQRLLLYVRYKNEYFSIKKKMQSEGMDVSLNDAGALSLREKAMQGRIDALLKTMEKRAAIMTIKDLQDVINRSSGDTSTYEKVLLGSIQKYNDLVDADLDLPKKPSDEDLNDRRNIHIDEFEGVLNTSPLIGRIHVLYRRFSRSRPGSTERSEIVKEMKKVADSKVVEGGETDAEKQARDGLKKFLAGDQNNVAQVDAELPVVELESVLMAGELIVSYIDQIIKQHKSHKLNDEDNLENIKKKREYISPLVARVLNDLMNTQYILARESAGFEGVRTGYKDNTPERGQVGDFGDNEGAGEQGRKHAIARIQTAIKHLKSPVGSSIGETIFEKGSKRIIDTARDIMKKFKSLDEILETDPEKIEDVSDILAEGKEERENVLEDFQIMEYLVNTVPKIPPPSALSPARQKLTEEALRAARAPYERGTSRLTLRDVQNIVGGIISKGNTDPAVLVMLYHRFDAQANFDLDRYSAVEDDKIKRLKGSGEEGQKLAKELEDAKEQVKENMRQGLLDLWNMLPWWLKALIIGVPIALLGLYIRPFIKVGGSVVRGGWRTSRFGVRTVQRFTTSSGRIAARLNVHPGMKAVDFVDDADRARKAMAGLREAKALHSAQRSVTALERGIAEAHLIKPTGRAGAWARGDIIKKWRVLKKAGFKPKEIRYLLKNGWCGRSADDVAMLLARNGIRAPRSLGAAGALDDIAAYRLAMQRGGGLNGRLATAAKPHGFEVGGRVLGALAMAWQAYLVYDRYNAAVETSEAVALKKDHIRDILVGNSEKKIGGLGFVEKGKNKFEHSESGITINIKSLDSSLDSETYARVAEAINAGAGFVVLGVATAVGGPVGLVIGVAGIVIEIFVDATIGEWETAGKEKFLMDAPAWLLTSISIAGTLNRSSYDMMNHLTNEEWSNMISGISGPEKIEVRHKLLFSMMCDDLASHSQGVLGSLFAEQAHGQDISFIDSFYKHDFKNFVLPMFYSRLSGEFDGKWKLRTKDSWKLKDVVLPGSHLMRVVGRHTEDSKTNFISRANPVQIRRALRDAVASYLPYVHARRAMTMRNRLAKLRKEKGDPKADDEITVGDRKFTLSELVEFLGEKMTYCNKSNGYKMRKIGDMSDAELESMLIPFSYLNSCSRQDLYVSCIQDPISRFNMVELHETQQGKPGFKGNSWPMCSAANEVLLFNIRNNPNYSSAEQSFAFTSRRANHRMQIMAETIMTPQKYAERLLTEEVGTYFSQKPSKGYSRKEDWEEALYPDWPAQHRSPDGKVESARPRPIVLVPSRYSFPKGLSMQHLAEALATIKFEDPVISEENLVGVVVDIDTYLSKKAFGTERSNILRATFFFEDKSGKSFMMRRSMLVYKNQWRLLSPGLIDEELSKDWHYVEGSDILYRASDFEADPNNRNLRKWMEYALRGRLTKDAITRSNEAAGRSIEGDPDSSSIFVRNDSLAEAVYAEEAHTPTLYVSAPKGVDFTPGSDAFTLLESLAIPDIKDTSLPYEKDPAVVFVEFEQHSDGTLVALATYVTNTFAHADHVNYDSNSLLSCRRKAASLKPSTDEFYREKPVIGFTVHTYLRNTHSLGNIDDVLQEAFHGVKLNNQLLIDDAMLDCIEQDIEMESLGETFQLLPSGESIFTPDENTTVLFVPRLVTKQKIYHHRDGKKLFVRPQSFDKLIIHYDDERADRQYVVRSVYSLMQDPKLRPHEREQVIDYYCTPMTDARKTLERLMSLFPKEVSADGKSSYMSDFIDALMPRYEKAPDKKIFLRGIFESCLDLKWVHSGNYEYLSKVVSIPLRSNGEVRFPLDSKHILRAGISLEKKEGEKQEVRLYTGSPSKTIDGGLVHVHGDYDFSLSGFKYVEPGVHQYLLEDLEKMHRQGNAIDLVMESSFSNMRIKSFPVHFTTRRVFLDINESLMRNEGRGKFVKIGPREFVRILDSYSSKSQIVLQQDRRPEGEWHEYWIEGNKAFQCGARATLIREFNGEYSLRQQYFANALQLWDKWGRKPELEMSPEELEDISKNLSVEERDMRNDEISVNSWTIEQITIPSAITDRGSDEFIVPVRRLISLFPCLEKLEGVPIKERDKSWYFVFMHRLENLYKESKDPAAFLKKLFVLMEEQTQGQAFSKENQLDSILIAMGGLKLSEKTEEDIALEKERAAAQAAAKAKEEAEKQKKK